MRSRRIGRTDVEISEIALGTWGLLEPVYGPVDKKRFRRTVDAALDVGVSTFDVAPLWGEDDGEGERWLGEALEEHEDTVVITRAGALKINGVLTRATDKFSLIETAEASLRNLKRECLDLWLLHSPKEELLRSPDEWLEAAQELEDAGKIRAWGASLSTPDLARMALREGAQVLCFPFSLLRPHGVIELEPLLGLHDASVVARHPLSFGALGGRFNAAKDPKESDHRARRWTAGGRKVRARQIEALDFLVDDERDLPTAALRYVLHHTAIAGALVGARTAEQIEHAAQASMEPPYLSSEHVYRIRKTLAQQRI